MIASPSTYALAADRLWAAGLEDDPYFVAASKLRLGGAVAFADGAGVSVDPDGGPITAVAQLDDRLIAFKDGRIYGTTAVGGPDNSADDTTPWPLAARITSDVGAPYPPTVVEAQGTTVQGLVFRSNRGVRLLDRALGCRDIGGPVRAYDGLTVVAGVSTSAHEEIRLYTDTGTTLVLNTRFDQWSTFSPQPAVGAVDWDGRATYVGSDGFAWAEDTGSYLDDGTAFPMTIELGWVPLQGSLQGFGRVRDVALLGTYYSPHTLRVEMAFDYRDSYTYRRELPVTSSLRAIEYGGGSATGSWVAAYASAQLDHVSPTVLRYRNVVSSGNGFLVTVAGYGVENPTAPSVIRESATGSFIAVALGTTVGATEAFIAASSSYLAVATASLSPGTIFPFTQSFNLVLASGTDGGPGIYGSGSYGGYDPVYQFRFVPPRQRTEALRLRISDASPTGRDFDLTELKLRVATETERARMPVRKIR
jgi:hypothetical protein